MEYKLNIITPSIYSEGGLDNCVDQLSEDFAIYLKNRADNEFNSLCKYDKVPGLAFIHDFEEFEERFLVHSEYAVIIVSPNSQIAIRRFLPRLLVFLTSRSIWQNRFLFVLIGDVQVADSLVIHAPIKFSLDSWRTHDELSWIKLFDLVKEKWTPYIDEDVEEAKQTKETPNSNSYDNNVKKTVNVAIQGSTVVADSCYYIHEDAKQQRSHVSSKEASSNTEKILCDNVAEDDLRLEADGMYNEESLGNDKAGRKVNNSVNKTSQDSTDSKRLDEKKKIASKEEGSKMIIEIECRKNIGPEVSKKEEVGKGGTLEGAYTKGGDKMSLHGNNSRSVVSEIIDDFHDLEGHNEYLKSLTIEASGDSSLKYLLTEPLLSTKEPHVDEKEAFISPIHVANVKEAVDVDTGGVCSSNIGEDSIVNSDVKGMKEDSDNSCDKKQEEWFQQRTDEVLEDQSKGGSANVDSANADVIKNNPTGQIKSNFKISTRGKPRSSLASPTGLLQIAHDSKPSLSNSDRASTDNLSHGMLTEGNIIHRGNADLTVDMDSDDDNAWWLSLTSRISSINSCLLSVFRNYSLLDLRSRFKRADRDIKSNEPGSVSIVNRVMTWSHGPWVVAGMFVVATLLAPYAARLIKDMPLHLLTNTTFVPPLLSVSDSPIESVNPSMDAHSYEINNVFFHMPR